MTREANCQTEKETKKGQYRWWAAVLVAVSEEFIKDNPETPNI